MVTSTVGAWVVLQPAEALIVQEPMLTGARTRVVDFDEFIVRPQRAARAEFADHHVGRRGRGGGQRRTNRDGLLDLGSRIESSIRQPGWRRSHRYRPH